eukprot:XP_001689957.1 predicted protein [Chlamydomonas reinhardtii]
MNPGYYEDPSLFQFLQHTHYNQYQVFANVPRPAQQQSLAAQAPQQPNPYQQPRMQQQPAVYGAPGSFAGRRAMQPPGGASSISFGGGGGDYGTSSNYGANAAGGYGGAAAYGAGYGGGGADLSSQLNLPGGMRRPPSAGRRANAQSAGSAGGYGGGYVPSASPYSAGGYGGGGGSILSTPGLGGAGGYGGASAGSYGAGGYGATPSSSSYASPYSAGGYVTIISASLGLVGMQQMMLSRTSQATAPLGPINGILNMSNSFVGNYPFGQARPVPFRALHATVNNQAAAYTAAMVAMPPTQQVADDKEIPEAASGGGWSRSLVHMCTHSGTG